MFDLGSAVVLGLVIVGLVSLVYSLIYGDKAARVKAVVCLVVAIVAVSLVGASDFGHENVVLDRPLDTLNFASQMIVALLASGVASGVWQIGAKALSRVGATPGL